MMHLVLQLLSLLAWALDGCEWPTCRSGSVSPWKESRYHSMEGWVGPEPGWTLWRRGKKKFLPLPEFDPRTIQLAAQSLKPQRYLVSAVTYSGDSGLKHRPGERANLRFIVVSFSYCSFLPHLRCC